MKSVRAPATILFPTFAGREGAHDPPGSASNKNQKFFGHFFFQEGGGILSGDLHPCLRQILALADPGFS